MDFEGALRARLLAAGPVTAFAGQRVTWVERPQASGLPAITLQIIGDSRPQTFDGFQAQRPATVQIDVWASTYAATKVGIEAVIATLAPAETSNGITFSRGFFSDVRDLGEQLETAFLHRNSVDLTVWHGIE